MGIRRLVVCLGMVVAVAASAALVAGGAAHGSFCDPTLCGGNGGPFKGVNAACSTDNTIMSATTSADQVGGSTWARLFVRWGQFERDSPGSSDEWDTTYISQLQSCIQKFHNHGENVLVEFYSTPCWAQSTYPTACTSPQGSSGNPLAPDGSPLFLAAPPNNTCGSNDPCYGTAAADLINDFADGAPDYEACNTAPADGEVANTFCGVQAVEVWNEENTSTGNHPYWTGSEGQYETLLQGAYEALSPLGVMVVTGGTTHKGADLWDSTLLSDEHDPTKGKQCPDGPQGNLPTGHGYCFDGLGVHLYPKSNQRTMEGGQAIGSTSTSLTNSPDIPIVLNGASSNTESDEPQPCTTGGYATCVDTLTRLVNDLNNRGLTTIPIWVTEMGWNTTDSPSWSDRQVANMLTNFYDYINGVAVPTNGSSPTCPATTCSRLQATMWFMDYVSAYKGDGVTLSPFRGYSMLYNNDPDDSGTYLSKKLVMTAFQNAP